MLMEWTLEKKEENQKDECECCQRRNSNLQRK